MIPAPFLACVCKRMGANPVVCDGAEGFAERGKRVRFTPQSGEQVWAVALDGCVFTDKQPKCDGLFVWVGSNRLAVCLVELKGAGNIPHAFEQLAFVRYQRPQYQQLIASLQAQTHIKPVHKAFVVTNGMLTKPEKERLENHHQIRVAQVLNNDATKPVPDLRKYV